MPTKQPTPAPISDDLLLAAIARAICHAGRNESAQLLSSIKEHLGLPHNGWTTIQLRPKLAELEAAGLIGHTRRDRSNIWSLTAKGRKRLDAIRADVTLPESPQHQRWREARVAASQRIAGFRGDLRSALDEAIGLLEAAHEADSAAWFEISERLHQAGRLFASAIYCLREWQEPDDTHADSDDDAPYRQHGRRNIHGWDSEFRF
jgi:DNA-binding transcriptional regulator PaaX